MFDELGHVYGPQILIVLDENNLDPNLIYNFIHYFENEWLQNDEKIILWNVHNMGDLRTNNDIEGYHFRLKNRLPNRIVSNFWMFIKALQKEEDAQRHLLTQMAQGGTMKSRDRSYVTIENGISFNLHEYNNHMIDRMQLLDAIIGFIGN
jgi:hypothetical protein